MPRHSTIDNVINRLFVNELTNCWEWSGCIDKLGYGKTRMSNVLYLVHRVIYEHFKGSIPSGLEIDHLCSNRKCANPDHLEAVTHIENIRRGRHAGREQTVCHKGHPLFGDNLYIDSAGRRHCRTCRRNWKRERKNMKNLLFSCILGCMFISPAFAAKELSGSLSLGVAGCPAQEFSSKSDSFCADLKLHYAPARCPLNFDCEARHMFFEGDNNIWAKRDKLVIGASLPVCKCASLFTTYERDYFGPSANDWWYSGVRLGF